MFNNIGGKIKTLATAITVIGIIISIIIGVMLTGVYGNGGFVIALVGSFFSWIGSFVLYGFGEMIDLLKKISGELGKSDNDETYEVDNTLDKSAKQETHKINSNNSEYGKSNDFWVCPQCNKKNSYIDKGNPKCSECGWHL